MLLNTSRHRCRNPHCRQQLPQLVESDRQAFCCKGCRESFYLRRCLVCEHPLAHQMLKFCGRRCRAEYRRSPHRYQQAKRFAGASVNLKQKVPDLSGFFLPATRGAAGGVATNVNLRSEVPIPRASNGR